VKGYSNLEYNLVMVVYELGGGHCLTALQKSLFAFPSQIPNNLVSCSVMRHLNYDAAHMDHLLQQSMTYMVSPLDELVIHNQSTTRHLCCLYVQPQTDVFR
jgi:hypothetical protein